MLVIQMIKFSSISSNKLLKLQKILNRVPTKKEKLTYFHQNQLPTFSYSPKQFFLGGGEKTISSIPEKCFLKFPWASPWLTFHAEAGMLTSGLPGLSAEAILFSLPTSACQPGTFLVVMWRRACFVRWSLRMKRRSHTGHTNFFSPV